MEKEERDAVVAALAQGLVSTRLLRALTHRLFAKKMLGMEDARVIFDYALSELEETSSQSPGPLFDDAFRLARQLVEMDERAIAERLMPRSTGPEGR